MPKAALSGLVYMPEEHLYDKTDYTFSELQHFLFPQYVAALLQGTLDLVILKPLTRTEMHGYEIAESIST